MDAIVLLCGSVAVSTVAYDCDESGIGPKSNHGAKTPPTYVYLVAEKTSRGLTADNIGPYAIKNFHDAGRFSQVVLDLGKWHVGRCVSLVVTNADQSC